ISGCKGLPRTDGPAAGFFEKDNLGTRHDTERIATAYWMTRLMEPASDPFILYDFQSEKAARDALLELPCIQVAQDSGNLICTEVLIFGHYPTKEGWHEAVICGRLFSRALFDAAKTSFVKHGGRPHLQGERAPEIDAPAPAKPRAKGSASSVAFIREERSVVMGENM